MPEELFSSCPWHTGGIFLNLNDGRNWIVLGFLSCFKFIPQNFVILTLFHVNKEVETSAAWFMIEINQEEGEFVYIGCKH